MGGPTRGGEKTKKRRKKKSGQAENCLTVLAVNRAQFAALSVSLMGDLDVRGELL